MHRHWQKLRLRAGGAVLAGLVLSSCATTGGAGGQPMSELEKANGRCVAAVVVGSLLGAVIGNNLGSGNSTRGAAIGAGAGGLACLVIREAAAERDQILAYQRMAAAANVEAKQEWVAQSGRRMVMTVEIEPDDVTPVTMTDGTAQPLCRYSRSTLQVEHMGETDIGRQRWCQATDGTWSIA